MKRNIFNTFVVFGIYCLFYEVGFFEFFFVEGGGNQIVGIILLAFTFLIVSSLVHFALDHWIIYEQTLEFFIKEKRVVEVQMIPSNNNMDGSPTLTIDPNFCGHEHFLIYARKDAPEEEFEKDVCENVFNAFEEGDIVHVHKTRSIVATHYKVVREKVIQ